MKKKIYLASPHMSKEEYEKKFIDDAFTSNWIAPAGKNIDSFEVELCKKVGIKYGTALSSGTAAIHMALKASNVQEGDIVICQSLTFAATANPIIYEKAIPVFVDSDFETWNMSPKYLEVALKKYPNAKAVIVVHLYGMSANMDEIKKICKKYDVKLIEDAAESLGTTYKGNHTGTIGDFGIYSFNGNKIITTSGGGFIVSNDFQKIEKVKFWSTQSKDNARHYEHSELGYNYRMSNVLAGIGRGQLKVLDRRIEKKKYIFNYYKKHLSEIENISFMPINSWNKPNYWISCIVLEGKIKPNEIVDYLEKKGIESRPIWKPMHIQPFYKKYDFIGEGISETIFNKGVCLPSDTKMNEFDLSLIVNLIQKKFGEKKWKLQ